MKQLYRSPNGGPSEPFDARRLALVVCGFFAFMGLAAAALERFDDAAPLLVHPEDYEARVYAELDRAQSERAARRGIEAAFAQARIEGELSRAAAPATGGAASPDPPGNSGALGRRAVGIQLCGLQDQSVGARRAVLDDWRGPYTDSDYPDLARGPEDAPYALTYSATYTMSTSSELASTGDNAYSAAAAFDGKPSTAWVEGVDGRGEGERIELTIFRTDFFGYPCVAVGGFSVLNGYGKSERLWRRNGRVRDMRVLVEGGAVTTVRLLDSSTFQHITFDEPVWVSLDQTLSFETLSTYAGTHYEDTAISELEVWVDLEAADDTR